MEIQDKSKYQDAFIRILNVLDDLRTQCPWDMKQTMASLRHLTIEETYELSDAILNEDMEEVKKELGDLLLHTLFYARIADEKKAFDITDVINSLCEKLIRRHPHIYGDVKAGDADEVRMNWEQIKLEEKREKGEKASVLAGVPQSLPALVKAYRIQQKARGAGFDWEETHQVWDKVKEEMGEFEEACSANQHVKNDDIEKEFGDILFSLINYARFMDIDPEAALEKTNKKFIHRFNYLEEQAQAIGKDLQDMSLNEMDQYWEAAKKIPMKK